MVFNLCNNDATKNVPRNCDIRYNITNLAIGCMPEVFASFLQVSEEDTP